MVFPVEGCDGIRICMVEPDGGCADIGKAPLPIGIGIGFDSCADFEAWRVGDACSCAGACLADLSAFLWAAFLAICFFGLAFGCAGMLMPGMFIGMD
jgi:hypothetical protein